MADWHATRLRYAQKIWHAASKLSALRVPVLPDGIEHAAYKCYVFLRPSMLVPAWSHDRIMPALAAPGVPVYSGSCSEVYLAKAFDGTGLRPAHRLPHGRASCRGRVWGAVEFW